MLKSHMQSGSQLPVLNVKLQTFGKKYRRKHVLKYKFVHMELYTFIKVISKTRYCYSVVFTMWLMKCKYIFWWQKCTHDTTEQDSSLIVKLYVGTNLTIEKPFFEMCTSFKVRYGIPILPICTSMKNFLFRSQAKTFGSNLHKRNHTISSISQLSLFKC